MEDPYRLDRFVAAQDAHGTYPSALSELRRGRKSGHWMWFVFPQMRGLGRSSTSHEYGITSLAEARAYLEHPVLGPRLLECAQLLLSIHGRDADEIFGSLDAHKLRSCMTLFSRADPGQDAFRGVLDAYFQSSEDPQTIRLLGGDG
jgi:uncharacterized protein (DUF1810 family)